MSRFAIKASDGYLTSRRVVWKDGERDVWSWRIDPGEPPLTFDTAEAATAWLTEVTVGCTRKERAEMDAYWKVEEITS